MDSAPQPVGRYQLRACWSVLIGRLTWKSHPLKPLQITTDTSFSLLDHASIGCHSREAPRINPGQWDRFGGLIRCPVTPLWLLAIIPDHYVVESHTQFPSSLTSKMPCKVFVQCILGCLTQWPDQVPLSNSFLIEQSSHIQANTQWHFNATCIGKFHLQIILCTFL